MKKLLYLLLTLTCLCGESSAQVFPECYGTWDDGDVCVYDGVTDNRFEFLDGGTLITNLCTDLLQCETPTDDSVALGNGTSFDIKALTDCDDTGGNHVNYDTTTNAFSCGTSSSVTDTDTNASTICSGSTTYLDGEGNCDTGTFNPFGSTIDDTELTNEDYGEFTCTGSENGCTLDAESQSIFDASDVTIAAAVAAGDMFIYTAGAFKNAPLADVATSVLGAGDVADLSDVTAWASWSPSTDCDPVGSCAWTASISMAQYKVMGDMTCITFATGVAQIGGGATAPYLTLSLPTTAISLSGTQVFTSASAYITHGTGEFTGYMQIIDNEASLRVYRMPDLPVFAASTDISIRGSMCYPSQ